MGEREKYLISAVCEMAKFGKIEKRSAIYESEPFGYKNQQNFLNAVCILKSDENVTVLFNQLKAIEKNLGRKESVRWGPRIIDLDIVDWDGEKVEADDLKIPHPQMYYRNFVLIPLADIEPDYKARDGRSIEQILEHCPSGFIRTFSKQW